MKTRSCNITLYLLLLLLICGCSKERKPTATQPDVYISGTKGFLPTCWKNGIEVFSIRENTIYNGTLAVSGTDIYLAASHHISLDNYAIAIWKNGSRFQELSLGIGRDVATAIEISNNDLYVTGYYYSLAGKSIAAYWKNGLLNTLTDGNANTRATAIYLKNNDIYIAGSYDDRPCYWKNGQIFFLASNILAITTTTGIAVSETGDPYTSGIEIVNERPKAIYWKNNTRHYLAPNSTGYSYANSIVLAGTDVYIAGSDAGNPLYWKNESPVLLSKSIAKTSANTNKIFIRNNDIYITGYEWTSVDVSSAKYWKNGKSIFITDGTPANMGFAMDIYVAP